MRRKLVTVLFGVTAAGCGWPFGTDTSCADKANCGSLGPDGGDGGASGDASTGGRSGASTGGRGGASGTGGNHTGGGGGSSDAGSDGDAGADVDATPPCDATASPSLAKCVVDEQYGVFVSPSGSDTTGDGSRVHPYATLAQAMSNVTATKRRIYACANGGSYAETLQNVASLDDIAFFGGFSCTDWTYDTNRKVQLVSPNTTAWTVNGLTKGLTIEDFAITAADATTPGGSSIAMVVIQSKNVVLRRTTVKAGKGADGAEGTKGTKGADGEAAGTDQVGKAASCTGAPASQLGGAWNGPSTCGSQGGSGGQASKNGNGSDGNPGTPDTDVSPPGTANGGSGATTANTDGVSGTNGSKGDDGTVGMAAALTGSFTAAGYTTADGGDGGDGHPGQGGGGGGASKGSATCVGASGGAGGMGGCGGTHGSGGEGGGASIALAVWQSSGVRLESVLLTAANGGAGANGGNGGDSGIGKGGALGGDATGSIGAAGGGGRGGNGGRGGAGSGGTGGPSYALLFNGTAPTKMTVTLTPGQGGAKGTGGFVDGTSGVNPAPDGSAGEAAGEREVP